jgi:hypothetical protein
MTLKNWPAKFVGAAIVLLVGGLGIASFREERYRIKQHAERSSEGKSVKTPLIQGHAATKTDFDSGMAIYYIPGGRSSPYWLGQNLPIRAELVKADGMGWPVGTQVSIVQAEILDGKHVTLGVLNGDKRGVCPLEDVKLLE